MYKVRMNGSTKIWRYMDLPKFVSLLTKRALHFASPLRFEDDPWEGYMPEALLKLMVANSHEKMIYIENQRIAFTELKGRLNPSHPEFARVDSMFDEGIQTMGVNHEAIDNDFVKIIEQEKENNGVNCWHINEQESEAMWKLYSAKGHYLRQRNRIY
jgi:hypothetical protein